jgi:hypothetical protein
MGQRRKEAATFLGANEKALTEQPVWLFSGGPKVRETQFG